MTESNTTKKLTLEVYVDQTKPDSDFCLYELLDDIENHDFVQDDTIQVLVRK